MVVNITSDSIGAVIAHPEGEQHTCLIAVEGDTLQSHDFFRLEACIRSSPEIMG